MAQFSMNNLPTNLLSQPIPMQKGARAYVGGRSVLDNIYGQSSNPSIQANPPSRFIPNLFPIDNSKRNFSALNQSPAEKQAIINQSYTRNNLPVPNNNNIVSRQPPITTANNRTAKPNMMNSLLNYASSPQGKGMARGILEASGYSTMPKSLGEILAKGMQYSQENVNTDLANKLAQRELDIKEKEAEAVAGGTSKDTASIKNFKFYDSLSKDEKSMWDRLENQSPELAYLMAASKASAGQGMADGVVLSKADLAFDEAAGKKLAKFYLEEYPQQLSNIDKIDDVIATMKSQEVTGAVEGGTPFALKLFTNPESIDVEDDIRSIIYQSLRATLGAQFTEKEGERLVAATFNKYLSEEVNIKRLERLREETVRGLDTKVAMYNHLKENDTLKTWEGADLLNSGEYKNNKNAIQQSLFSLEDYASFDGNSDELLKLYNSDISAAEKEFIFNNLEALGIEE